ncbi:hypothetical protein CISIN_1g0429271mg, partial [Citrus sinensis]
MPGKTQGSLPKDVIPAVQTDLVPIR